MPDHEPNLTDDLNRAGIVLANERRYEEALECFRRASEAIPPFAPSFNNMGFVLNALGRPEEALFYLRRAIELSPHFADAYNNMGIALAELGRVEEAIQSYSQALQIQPLMANAHNNLATELVRLGRHDEAISRYQQALRVEPGSASTFYNLGLLFSQRGRLSEATECFTRATELKPDFAEAFRNLGALLADCRRPQEAIAAFTKALAADPNLSLARAQRLHQLARLCDWTEVASELAAAPNLGLSGGVVPPFAMLSLEDRPDKQLVRARRFATERYGAVKCTAVNRHGHEKLRIGYFSADFQNHAVMHLIARVFELHDRSRFHIHAFSFGPDVSDSMRARIKAAVDHFHEVRGLSDDALAAFAREQAIDVAIDLTGYTQGARTGVFARRVAAAQINYLGYPGTMGAPFMDFIIADRTIIPPDCEVHFSEKIIYLPHTYQANDNTRAIASDGMSRAEAGLPDAGFVFCCFNNTYKITSAEFDVWMPLMDLVEGSTLWLLQPSDEVAQTLRAEAVKRGVNASRLVFAKHLPAAEHLARHRLADLFLDTFVYNAHTTASDALWAGLPVVTKLGHGFAARVCGSLLIAIGLGELVTSTEGEYAELAHTLANNPDRLRAIRSKLETQRLSAPLFNSELITRDLEAAFERAHASAG